jgi:hypothetical protein
VLNVVPSVVAYTQALRASQLWSGTRDLGDKLAVYRASVGMEYVSVDRNGYARSRAVFGHSRDEVFCWYLVGLRSVQIDKIGSLVG